MARYAFATYPQHAGKTRLVTVGSVTHYVDYVPFSQAADIVHKRYTANYSERNSRPFVTKRAGYATLEAAVKSLIKNGT